MSEGEVPPPSSGDGGDETQPSTTPAPAEEEQDAAAAALARARAVAATKGLRPGMKPRPKRKWHPRGVLAGTGRDPMTVGEQVERLVGDRGWQVDVAAGSVMGRWPEIVGRQVAEHCEPVSFEAGVLSVRADSTAWATQIRLLSSSLLGSIAAAVGPDVVHELRVHGPSAPSWSRGPRRTSDGRGPRDTYG